MKLSEAVQPGRYFEMSIGELSSIAGFIRDGKHFISGVEGFFETCKFFHNTSSYRMDFELQVKRSFIDCRKFVENCLSLIYDVQAFVKGELRQEIPRLVEIGFCEIEYFRYFVVSRFLVGEFQGDAVAVPHGDFEVSIELVLNVRAEFHVIAVYQLEALRKFLVKNSPSGFAHAFINVFLY